MNEGDNRKGNMYRNGQRLPSVVIVIRCATGVASLVVAVFLLILSPDALKKNFSILFSANSIRFQTAKLFETITKL